MIEPVILINTIFAALAVIFGLSSRNFATATVAGLLMGLVHAGLLALRAAQSGSFELLECPYLRDGIDFVMKTGYLNFANARFIAYLVAIALVTMIAMMVAYIIRWIVVSLVSLVTPKRTESVEA
jgi:hypothetical protein